MLINKTTIDFKYIRQLLNLGEQVILFMRHSERPEICTSDKDFGKHLGLTENGIAMCREAGAVFQGIQSVEFFASPMERCRLTAKHLAEGMGIESARITETPEIGIDGFYMQPDRHALQELMKQHGYMEYMVNYLNAGTAPHLNPIKSATRETFEWMQSIRKSQLSVFVSHDIYITAFLTALGVRKFTGDDWIGFLQGAVLSRENESGEWCCHSVVPSLQAHKEPAGFSR